MNALMTYGNGMRCIVKETTGKYMLLETVNGWAVFGSPILI